jgi:hypothetical protein
MPLNHKKERCTARAKAKAKAIRTSFFFGLDVFSLWFGYPFSFYPVKLAIFLFHCWPLAADQDRSQRMLCPGPD